MKNRWYVSRQSYWHSGDSVIEIAYGGLDYANPDMLADPDGTYQGLVGEYGDPRGALKAAFRIRELWGEGRIEVGCTSGFTAPFEEHPSDEWLKEWAEREYDALPKCDFCGSILPDVPWMYYDYDELGFCTEYCADAFCADFLGGML